MLKDLQSIFNALSTGVVVLDKNVEIKFLNSYMSSIIKTDRLEGEHLGQIFGNLFTCIHSEDSGKPCGETGNCPECPLRNSINEISSDSQIIVFEKDFYLVEENQKIKKHFGISMKPIINSLDNEILIEIFPIKHDKIHEYYIHHGNIDDINKKIYKDILTNLYNRNFYEEKISEIYKYTDKLTAILLDIDNFKNLNDTLGHLEGDEALKEISKVIEENITSNDYAIRMGGDEFLILIKNDKIKALEIAESILNKLKKNKKSISIGIASKKNEFITITDLYKKADMALYAAKKNGKGTIVTNY